MNHRLILSAALALAAPAAFCQQQPVQPPADQQGPPAMQQPHRREMRFDREGGPMEREGGEMHMRRGGMRGEWWKNPEMVKRVGLTPDQTKKLDDLSLQGKLNMIHLQANLEEQEVMLKPLMEGPSVDERKADLQIDKVAEARASLEKAEAKLHLSMRAVLTADQWAKMHEPMANRMGGMHHQEHGEGPVPQS